MKSRKLILGAAALLSLTAGTDEGSSFGDSGGEGGEN